ncbi:MAG: hypothetical protein JWR68_1507 [Polaromonas sp.]|nr:hypothetical protein [Polaromonas sp.]
MIPVRQNRFVNGQGPSGLHLRKGRLNRIAGNASSVWPYRNGRWRAGQG